LITLDCVCFLFVFSHCALGHAWLHAWSKPTACMGRLLHKSSLVETIDQEANHVKVASSRPGWASCMQPIAPFLSKISGNWACMVNQPDEIRLDLRHTINKLPWPMVLLSYLYQSWEVILIGWETRR
jgi:hypothetical protein